jgi:hypothetical protein
VLHHRVRSLRGRNLEIVRLTKTLIRHVGETPESEVGISLFQLGVVALCPDQGQVAGGVLGAETALACSVDHLWVVVVPLSVYLVRQVLLVDGCLC